MIFCEKIIMPFPSLIESALNEYDQNKGLFRKFSNNDQAAIKAIRKLPEAQKKNLLAIYRCFKENMPNPDQASYQVYRCLLACPISEEYKAPMLGEILNAFNDSKDQYQERCYHLLAENKQPRQLMGILTHLKEKNLLEHITLTKLAEISKTPRLFELTDLIRKGRLTLENLKAFLDNTSSLDPHLRSSSKHILPPVNYRHRQTTSKTERMLNQALTTLLNSKIDINEWRPMLEDHPDPSNIAEALVSLKQANLCTSYWVRLVEKQACPLSVAEILQSLKMNNIFTVANIEKLTNILGPNEENNPYLIALINLNDKNFLTQKTLDLVLAHAHAHPENCAQALLSLKKSHLFCDSFIEKVSASPHPHEVADSLAALKNSMLLTAKNANNLYEMHSHEKREHEVAEALVCLSKAGILTQKNLDTLLATENQWLISASATELIWEEISLKSFTQEIFDQLIIYCQQPQPTGKIFDYMQQNHLVSRDSGVALSFHSHFVAGENVTSDTACQAGGGF